MAQTRILRVGRAQSARSIHDHLPVKAWQRAQPALELACLIRRPCSLDAALEQGVDCVHFTDEAIAGDIHMKQLVQHVHAHGTRAVLELRGEIDQASWQSHRAQIRAAAESGVDALACVDAATLLYAAARYPHLPRVARLNQCAPAAVRLLCQRYGPARVMLPAVSSMRELEALAHCAPVELQVAVHGLRYGTGNACSRKRLPHDDAAHESVTCFGNALAGVSLGRCGDAMPAANDHVDLEPAAAALGMLALLPRLRNIGVRAILIDVDHESTDICSTIGVWREAINACVEEPQHYSVDPAWIAKLCRQQVR